MTAVDRLLARIRSRYIENMCTTNRCTGTYVGHIDFESDNIKYTRPVTRNKQKKKKKKSAFTRKMKHTSGNYTPSRKPSCELPPMHRLVAIMPAISRLYRAQQCVLFHGAYQNTPSRPLVPMVRNVDHVNGNHILSTNLHPPMLPATKHYTAPTKQEQPQDAVDLASTADAHASFHKKQPAASDGWTGQPPEAPKTKVGPTQHQRLVSTTTKNAWCFYANRRRTGRAAHALTTTQTAPQVENPVSIGKSRYVS